MSNGLERLFSPSLLDVIFPVIAFLLVIALPSAFGIYVIVKTCRGQLGGNGSKD